MQSKNSSASLLWDRLGIGVSGVCAIHCLFFPVIISTLPVWSFAPAIHGWAHPLFIAVLIPVVYFAAKRSHYDKKITSMLAAGIIFVLAGWLLGHFWLGLLFETTLTVLGSVLLIIGHWFNYSHHRTCKNRHHNHHPEHHE